MATTVPVADAVPRPVPWKWCSAVPSYRGVCLEQPLSVVVMDATEQEDRIGVASYRSDHVPGPVPPDPLWIMTELDGTRDGRFFGLEDAPPIIPGPNYTRLFPI